MSTKTWSLDLSDLDAPEISGHVIEVRGPVVRAQIPLARVGDIVLIRGEHESVRAEVVGFDRNGVILVPLVHLRNARLSGQAEVVPCPGEAEFPCGERVRGRVLDALGQPIDGRGPLSRGATAPLQADPPNPMLRLPVQTPVPTGVKALDGLLTVGRGQRVGIFAGAGVGKSTLLGSIAREVDADLVVLALIGERGREVRDFVEDDLRAKGLARAVVIVSTSDQPALLRLRAAYAATAIAESARAEGQNVVLMMDSVTRFARALREIGLAAGEPPTRQGFPSSVFATLPQLFERAGNDSSGTMTAFYTVLVAGNDEEEPVSDETRSLLDGHIVLSKKLFKRRRYLPAIDIPASISRLMPKLTLPSGQLALADRAVEVLAAYEENYDKIQAGLYDPPSARERGYVERYPALCEFLDQRGATPLPLEATALELRRALGPLAEGT